MPNERAERLAELVKSALELPAQSWSAFLDQECKGEAELRAEIESLLAQQQGSGGFLEEPALGFAAEDLVRDSACKLGQIIGDYEILSLIARGGMGEVYLAHDRKLRRKVALKLIRRGMDTADIVRHFEREGRLLAGLNHLNIAQLYGSGVTAEGNPFFAMEYVAGQRLDEYCEERSLTTSARLDLFRKICAAVTYAHQHLVIHRDIKPANIRVTAAGEPKLLDFGIAKLLEPEASLGGEQTLTLASVMTPEYASPEQVRGETVATTSDVYSLGVVLYRLLTGQSPYRPKTTRPDELARAITDQDPDRPSTAVANDQKSEVSNQKSLRGDLDNIVLMAMRKEPARRYQSVVQFSDDIRRHLDGLPVSAHKDTVGYRASKFIRRHQVGVLAALLVAATLVAGIFATEWEARRANKQRLRAERRFEDVRQLAHSLMFEIHDSVRDLQGSTPTRRLIVTRALQYLDGLAQEAGENPSLQRELATAYEKVGDIQGNPYSANLGDTEGALTSYRKAARIRETLRQTGATTETEMELGRTCRAIGDVLEVKGDLANTLDEYRRSLQIFEQVAQRPEWPRRAGRTGSRL
ncbi:MAG: serine/threonine protein kinase [Chthoniobacterales bacterium]|nr:serine/threonine protein kinase [Chthoniobacterales bacterium]